MKASLRPATPADQLDIIVRVRSERLNPTGLRWSRFTVAVGEDGFVVGAVQLRRHPDGSRELGSFVVADKACGRGVGARLIDVLLQHSANPVHMITVSRYVAHYRRWGFRPIELQQVPRAVRMNYRLGRLARLLSIFRGLPPKNLVIFERAGGASLPESIADPVRVRRRAGVMA